MSIHCSLAEHLLQLLEMLLESFTYAFYVIEKVHGVSLL